MRIRKGDTVYVRSGADKGKTGRVLHVDVAKNSILVEGLNMRKKHQRPTQKSPKGGVVTIEAPMHLSNVALWSASLSKPVKIAARLVVEGGKKHRVRINAVTGEQI